MTAMTDDSIPVTPRAIHDEMVAFGIMTALLLIVPLTGIYPFFVMQALCFALLACAFNLLIGYGGLLSIRRLKAQASSAKQSACMTKNG